MGTDRGYAAEGWRGCSRAWTPGGVRIDIAGHGGPGPHRRGGPADRPLRDGAQRTGELAGDRHREQADSDGEGDLGGLAGEREGDRPRAQQPHQCPHARQPRNPAPM